MTGMYSTRDIKGIWTRLQLWSLGFLDIALEISVYLHDHDDDALVISFHFFSACCILFVVALTCFDKI